MMMSSNVCVYLDDGGILILITGYAAQQTWTDQDIGETLFVPFDFCLYTLDGTRLPTRLWS